jgi:CHAD domain-containing protein
VTAAGLEPTMHYKLTETRAALSRVTPATIGTGHGSNSSEPRVAPLNPSAKFRIPPAVPVPMGKWVAGISGKQSVKKNARRILGSRLFTVLHWLPLAAHHSSEDVEYVHQLRVATRRAVEAVRMFSNLFSDSTCAEVKAKLRAIRSAAGEARNLDVLMSSFLNSAEGLKEDDACRDIAAAIRERRSAAQQPIVAIEKKLLAEKFDRQIESMLNEIRSGDNNKFKRSYGPNAGSFLKPSVNRFLNAAKADLSDDEALHKLRIETKKLRYSMEHVAPVFKPRFRNEIYHEISSLQDLLGAVNDRAMATTVLANWITSTDDARQAAFFRGMLLAETKAREDLREALHVVWTPKVVRRLRRTLRDYCENTRR